MLYLLAVLLPPVAVVVVSKSALHRVLSLLLTAGLAWVPGVIHALVLVRRYERHRARSR